MTDQTKDALDGMSAKEREIMLRLLRAPRQQQKEAPKPMSVRYLRPHIRLAILEVIMSIPVW
jgi:hypothetical protein